MQDELGGLLFDLLSYFFYNLSCCNKLAPHWQQQLLMFICSFIDMKEMYLIFFLCAPIFPWCCSYFFCLYFFFFPCPLSSVFPLLKGTLSCMWRGPKTRHLLQLLSYLRMSKPLRLSVCLWCLPSLSPIFHSSFLFPPSFIVIAQSTTFHAVIPLSISVSVVWMWTGIRCLDRYEIQNGNVFEFGFVLICKCGSLMFSPDW